MNAPDVKLTIEVLIAVATISFTGFKNKFKQQADQDAAERARRNARSGLWSQRRLLVSRHLYGEIRS